MNKELETLKTYIKEADAIIIGAGSGLSTSAGYTYSGERFTKYFSDFIDKYGFDNAYSGGFYPFESLEEYWAYWSRYIYINRYAPIPKSTYTDLYNIIKDKDYFVLTTNVDHCFQRAGFDKDRLFYTQGDYGLFQCSDPCHDETYDNEEIVKEMVLAQGYTIDDKGELIPPINNEVKMTIPSELIPTCRKCEKPLTTNLRADDSFVQDEGWYKACNHFIEFLSNHGITGSFGFVNVEEAKGESNQNILYLELGVGGNTPVLCSLRTTRKLANNTRKQQAFGHTHGTFENQKERRCA